MDKGIALPAARGAFYASLLRRPDALFELTDAMLTSKGVPSPPHLSLAPVHRRGWGSIYAALAKGSMCEEKFRELLTDHPLADGTKEEPRVYAVDLSIWPRSDAEASPKRGFYYHPSRHSAGQPIVAGWAYQWIAELGFSRDSWVAPVDARRVRPDENQTEVCVTQIKDLLDRLWEREQSWVQTPPLFVFDAGYDATRLTRALQYCRAQILVRLNSQRCFYGDPLNRAPTKGGRPRRHGHRFVSRDPDTWPDPTDEHRCEHRDYGEVRVRSWSGLHPKLQSRPGAEPYERPPIVRGTVVLVEVQKLPRQTRELRKLWLW